MQIICKVEESCSCIENFIDLAFTLHLSNYASCIYLIYAVNWCQYKDNKIQYILEYVLSCDLAFQVKDLFQKVTLPCIPCPSPLLAPLPGLCFHPLSGPALPAET